MLQKNLQKIQQFNNTYAIYKRMMHLYEKRKYLFEILYYINHNAKMEVCLFFIIKLKIKQFNPFISIIWYYFSKIRKDGGGVYDSIN